MIKCQLGNLVFEVIGNVFKSFLSYSIIFL